jgi:hypothetical protein
MIITLKIFLYLYIAFLFAWISLSVSAVYHMFKWGFKNFITYLSTFIFVVVSVLMLLVSFYFISQIDWDINITEIQSIYSNPFSN